MSLNKSKRPICLKEYKCTQNEHECAHKCLNRLKGAWMSLHKPKSALMRLNELKWTNNPNWV